MLTQGWMYDGIIYIYSLSLLFYFADFTGSNRHAKKIGRGFLIAVWLLQTVYFIYTLSSVSFVSLLSMFQTLYFLSWILITFSLAMSWFLRIELLVFFINIAGFAVLALNLFSDPNVVPSLANWRIADELLFVHITLALSSYAAFLMAALLSGMYIFLHYNLKAKRWLPIMKRFPSLEQIDKYTNIAVIIGTPLLIAALSLGVVWIALLGDQTLLLDVKVINSLLILGAYTFYLILRISLKTSNDRMALWNLTAFAVVLCNLLVSNDYSDFHRFIGGE